MKRNEAIEIVREYYPSSGKDLNEALETLIPELKESEDERIRKWIKKELESKYVVDNIVNNVMADKALAWLEKQGSQNLANSAKTCKIEPKFKVGDWVRAISSGNIFKILSVNDGLYRVLCYDGVEANYPIEVEKDLAYWTIEDAKEGDVLLFEGNYNSIVLFQGIGINGKGRINYHCKCDLGDYSFSIQGDVACLGTIEKDAEHYHPATKEQRDLLFQKMKEAGYEWDAEKKELKKIDNEEVNGEDYGIDSLWHAQRILEKTLGKVDGYQTDDGILEHKCAINAVKKLYEQNPAWSEEDEDIVDNIIKAIQYLLKENDSWGFLEDCPEWLKALKGRCTWKPSDEQMNTLEQWLKNNRYRGDARYCYPIFDSLYQCLKKLKG